MKNSYPLHAAVLKVDKEAINAAIIQGSDLNQLDELGNAPLHWCVLRGDDEIVKQLLEAGAAPNVHSSDGVTPLWSAVDFGLVNIANLLIQYGAKVMTNDKFDRTSWTVFKHALGQDLPKETDGGE